MPDLLLELRSEEIPARMQRKAAGDLRKMVTDGLVEAGLTYEAAREYWTPRRLALDVRGLTARSKDVHEEIKGPSTKAPEQAVQGFLRKAGLTDVGQAHIHSDPKKGDFYVAHLSRPGRPAEEIIAELTPAVIRAFPWPKSMRWGKASARPGSLRWVRPLQSILCTFGPETEEPVVVDFEVDGIHSGNVTYGHRFHAPEAIIVRRFDDYVAKLEAAKVVLDAERRKAIIAADARNLAFANGLELVEDEGLLEEVAGLVEWPVVLMGEFEENFLDIPGEIIRLTIRANQKCFVTRGRSSPLSGEVSAERMEGGGDGALDPSRTGPGFSTPTPSPSPQGGGESVARLANRFILTANIEASDGGAEIARGNGKVVRARLSDAVHFWKTDQADLPDLDRLKESAQKFGLDLGKPLDQRMARLDHLGVTFHAKLGTQGERVERIAQLAEEIAATLLTSPLRGGRPASIAEPSLPAGAAADGDTGGAGGGNSAPIPPPLTPPLKGEGDLKALARRAAVLAKADLQTEVVGEFPELQGQMGRTYALLQGEDPKVAAAIEEHYRPQGPSDVVPTDPVSIAVALADKLDTLTGFWAIDEKPTGSKDPYALRRAALGVIRILVENGVGLSLNNLANVADEEVSLTIAQLEFVKEFEEASNLDSSLGGDSRYDDVLNRMLIEKDRLRRSFASRYVDLLSFLHDRLKVYLRDKGARHDLIDAVLAGGAPSLPLEGRVASEARRVGSPARGATSPVDDGAPFEGTPPGRPSAGHPPLKGEGGGASNDDLLVIVRKVEALGALLDTEDGKNLLAGTRRAANILAAEEKKGTAVASHVDPALFTDEAERTLFEAVNQAERQAGEAIEKQDFSAAMRALSQLRGPVDAFFEKVLVNDEDVALRANRLGLLARIRAATGQVADFSKIAG